MEMNEESILAWNIIEKTNANLFLTGKAGTGKTTFLKRLKELSPKRMIVLAPTGIAAINAGGMTIHSFFQLPFSPYVPGTTFGSGEQKRYQFSKLKRNIIRSIDLLVIDEISMVRSDLLDAVDSVLRQYRKRHDLPFGSCIILMAATLVLQAVIWRLVSFMQFFLVSLLAAIIMQVYRLKRLFIYRG